MTALTDTDTLPSGQELPSAIAEGVRAYELDRAHVR